MYSAIPSQPFQIDSRYKRNYHDALGNSLKEACIRQYSMFKTFCSQHIEMCESRKNVFEISQTEMEVAADWSSIAEDLTQLSIIISEHQIRDVKFIESQVEELGQYNAFPLYAKRRELFHRCVQWNDKIKEIFRDVSAEMLYVDEKSKVQTGKVVNFGHRESADEDPPFCNDKEAKTLNDPEFENDIGSLQIENNSKATIDNLIGKKDEKSTAEQSRSTSMYVSNISSDRFGQESESSRSKSSKNIEDLMESFATDMRPSDSGVNRVLKMFTGATVSDNIAHSEAAAIEVPILHQLTVGCPSLNTGANGMFCPVDKDLPSTIIAHSLASLHMQYSLNIFLIKIFIVMRRHH